MRVSRILFSILVIFLYSCATPKYTDDEKIFYEYLAKDYRSYGDYKTENYDWKGARIFYRKARTIDRGNRLMPEEVFRDLDVVDFFSRNVITYEQLLDMRDRMFLIINNDTAKQEYPEEVANLQFYYDCWILEERLYVKYSQMARCKQGFIDALAYLEFKLLRLNITERDLIASEIDKNPIEPFLFNRPKKYIVEFDFDSSVITEDATRTLWTFLDDWKTRDGQHMVNISGHADRVGTRTYNQKLSRRRVDTVRHYLIRNGVPEEAIKVTWLGEIDPQVITSDERKEELNRRVVITLDRVEQPTQ